MFLTCIAVFLLVQFFFGYACPLRKLTGFSCPCCGMTRAWRCFLQGDIKGAFFWHPLFLLPVPAGLILLFEKSLTKRVRDASGWCVAIILIVFYICRMAVHSPALNRDYHDGLIWQGLSFIAGLLEKYVNGSGV